MKAAQIPIPVRLGCCVIHATSFPAQGQSTMVLREGVPPRQVLASRLDGLNPFTMTLGALRGMGRWTSGWTLEVAMFKAT
ncbi:hypothetical protein K437DRAFT_32269 [Tilletiaria anomala UBC 951]|uniref:Uncharacterized protein n=1 Tax=Tilletiaria anomala (strain ATCC 24038 / CBS 436.72 / UBC 951) TaxID=1037660 RepID=A0A066VCA8_TILAU|nr:uncharacterized protein K437DRAFT_32269 [Tilletiaria anomala UBC 951]KDN37918.1 hypothetical protein K437DRAFT_32269 [Tilletiaria anomala UBC 951]